MAERTAKIHRNQSNRAKVQDPADRKVVYKGVLDNPFRIQWPRVPLNIQNSLLALVISLLEGVAEYQFKDRELKRKRKRLQNTEKSRKKSKTSQETLNDANVVQGSAVNDTRTADETAEPSGDAPEILHHVTVGINEVTKDLENIAKSSREALSDKASDASRSCSDSLARLVLVCRDDVDPPILIGHLPHLVAACDSTRHRLNNTPDVWLVPLSKGAESPLAAAMALRRVAVMTVKSTAPGFSKLTSLLESVPTLSAPWLRTATTAEKPVQPLIPTHIKQLRTTAPKDLKAAKERRGRERASAKDRVRKAKTDARSRTRIPERIIVSG